MSEYQQIGAYVARFDTWSEEEAKYKHNYNYQRGLLMQAPAATTPIVALRLRSHQAFSLADGGISIHFNHRCTLIDNESAFFNGNGSDRTGFAKFRMQIRVGGHYWNGAKWVEDPQADFTAQVGGSESTPKEPTGSGKVITTKTLAQKPNGLEGYYIPITTPMVGQVEFILYTHGHYNYTNSVIDGLEVKFTRFQEKTKAENEYTILLSREFAEEERVDVKFATDNGNAFGAALLITWDGKYMQKIPYTDGDARPEEHLLERMAEVYRRPRHKITATFKSPGAAAIRPGDLVEDWGGQNGYATTAISRNYRDDTTTLTLQRVREY